jgi:hypothetical protein
MVLELCGRGMDIMAADDNSLFPMIRMFQSGVSRVQDAYQG